MCELIFVLSVYSLKKIFQSQIQKINANNIEIGNA